MFNISEEVLRICGVLYTYLTELNNVSEDTRQRELAFR
jgi:hypothetical protein